MGKRITGLKWKPWQFLALGVALLIVSGTIGNANNRAQYLLGDLLSSVVTISGILFIIESFLAYRSRKES